MVWKGLYIVGQDIFFSVVNFINKLIVEFVDFNVGDVVNIKIVVECGCGCKFVMCFQFNFIGFVYFKMCQQCEIVWLVFLGGFIVLQFKCQYYVIIIFIMCFQCLWQIMCKVV